MTSTAVSKTIALPGMPTSLRGRNLAARSFLAAALTASLVVGCATTPDRVEPGAMRTETKHYATVVRLMKSCPSDAHGGPNMQTAAAGAAAAVVGLVADTVTKWIAAELKDRQDGLTATYIGRGTGAAPGCLVVVRGLHGDPGDDVVESPKTILKKGMLKQFKLADYPDLYFEASVDAIVALNIQKLRERAPSPKKEGQNAEETVSYAVTPKLLYFRNTAAKYTENDRKSLLMSVHMSAAQASAAKAGESDNPTLTFAFDNVPIGVEISPIPSQSAILVLPKAMKGQELNLLAQITETEDPSLFAKAFAESFDENKADISKALEEILTRAFSKAKANTKDE